MNHGATSTMLARPTSTVVKSHASKRPARADGGTAAALAAEELIGRDIEESFSTQCLRRGLPARPSASRGPAGNDRLRRAVVRCVFLRVALAIAVPVAI